MTRCAVSVAMMIGLLASSGCQSPTSASSSDTYELSFSPNPTTATASSGVFYTVTHDSKPDESIPYAWTSTVTVTVKNTSSLGATITALNVNVQQASGGIVITPTTGDSEHYQFSTVSNSPRVEGNGGTQTTTFTIWYSLPNQGKEALLSVNFSLKDDDDNVLAKSDSVRILP